MAPESNTLTYDEKIDIYSAAVTFYELFEQASFDVDIPFGCALTPEKFRPLIKKMGSDDPKSRPSALDLIDLFCEASPKAGSSGSAACALS